MAAPIHLRIEVPTTRDAGLRSPGVFIQPEHEPNAWTFIGADAHGDVVLTLPKGSYRLDTVEPAGHAEQYTRHRYIVSVDRAGVGRIAGLNPDAAGTYLTRVDPAVTLTPAAQQARERLTQLGRQSVAAFTPTSACQMPDLVTPERTIDSGTSTGFPKVNLRLPSNGTIRALVVPIDFPDLAGRDDPRAYYTPIVKQMSDFYARQSYGHVRFEFDILPQWQHFPRTLDAYGFDGKSGVGDFTQYVQEAVRLTDGNIDYTRYDMVYFLVPKEMPMTRMKLGPAVVHPIPTRNGIIINAAIGGADMYAGELTGADATAWKWMAHETGHTFGLIDEDYHHSKASLGSWSMMANCWSRRAIELTAWDRYLQGWLEDSEVACHSKPQLTNTTRTVLLSPIERQDKGINKGVKAFMLPLGPSRILVAESRRNEGYDHLTGKQNGVLVYTVDTALNTMEGGYRIIPRPGSTQRDFEDGALHAGDEVSLDGITLRVTHSDGDGDTIVVSGKAK